MAVNNQAKFQKNVTDDMVEEYMAPYIEYFMSKVMVGQKPCNKTPSKKKQNELNKDELAYLQSICTQPYLNNGNRKDFFGHSSTKNNNIKNSLLDKKLIGQFVLPSKPRNSQFLALTKKGFLALGLAKEIPAGLEYNASPEHFFWQRGITAYYQRAGIKAEIEKMVKGTRVDVALIGKNGEMIAIEVELSAENCCSNVRKDIDAGFVQIIEAAKDNTVKKSIEKKLAKNFKQDELQKVKVMLLTEFPFVKAIIDHNKA